MTTALIVAIDLGKYKSAVCLDDPVTVEANYQTLITSPARSIRTHALRRLTPKVCSRPRYPMELRRLRLLFWYHLL